MKHTLLGLILSVLSISLPLAANAQTQSELNSRTHRGVSLEGIVKDLAAKSDTWASSAKKQSLVIWLVDNTPQMAKLGLHKQLGQLIADKFQGKVNVKHAVVLIDAKLHLVQKPTDALEELKSALTSVAQKPQDQIRNTMAAIAACAQGFPRRYGRKAIVLFTVENGDTEHYTEQTGLLLKRTKTKLYVISREGIYSDPYWKQRRTETKKHKPLLLAGAETPLIEYPWGFLFQERDPQASIPAGYGIYGLNRLVTRSGGAYYLYDPPSSSSYGYCSYASCRVCSGLHKRCAAVFDRYLIKQYEPSALSRAQYASLVQRNPVWRLIRAAWSDCYKMGLFQSKPPKLTGSVSKSSRSGNRSYYNWNLGALAQAAAKATKDRQTLDAYIARLAKLPKPKRMTPFWRRTIATADVLRCQLMVTKFNLGQLIHLHASWSKIVLSGLPQSEIEAPYLSCGLSASTVALFYDNYLLCHGTQPLKAIRWLGGLPAEKELVELASVADKMIGKYNRTPWELLIRRAGLVKFYISPPAN